MLRNRVRFIISIVNGELVVTRVKKQVILSRLK